LTEHAIRCFQAQTYPRKHLLIFDSGSKMFELTADDLRMAVVHAQLFTGSSIGALRNAANELTRTYGHELLVHWDSDDWSHPNRLTEQVALLQASGADAVGYNEMLFWRNQLWDGGPGGAWMYSNPRPNYALGTSLCYWRKTWERSPFTDGPKPEGTSEYHHWFKQGGGVRVQAVSGLGSIRIVEEGPPSYRRTCGIVQDESPRMIARIHGKNFGAYDIEKQIAGGSREWKRVPAWDARLREILS
jgi:hypothetical protein